MLQTLRRAGLLICGGERDRLESKMPIRSSHDSGRDRMYCIRGDILPEFSDSKIRGNREAGVDPAPADSPAPTPEATTAGGPTADSAHLSDSTAPPAVDSAGGPAANPTAVGARAGDADLPGSGNETPAAADAAPTAGRLTGDDADPPDDSEIDTTDGSASAPDAARVTGDDDRPPNGDAETPDTNAVIGRPASPRPNPYTRRPGRIDPDKVE